MHTTKRSVSMTIDHSIEEPCEVTSLTHGVRREALCRIPGAARKNLEERSWVNRLTQHRKADGNQSMPVKRWSA
jgi:hypothetical protein